MKKILFLLIPVLRLSICDVHAQGEIWSATETKIFKADATNPTSISTVEFLDEYSGYYPGYRLTLAGNGKVYTVTSGPTGFGAIIEYDPATRELTRRFEFNGSTDGRGPNSLTLAGNGKLYGVTTSGGTNDAGVLFEYDPANNAYTKKFDFASATGNTPSAGITLAVNGKLYGLTNRGGTSDFGVLYEYDPAANAYNKKIDFNGSNGMFPNGDLTLGANNKLYGVMEDGGGIIFEYDPAAVTDPFAIKHRFDVDDGNGAIPINFLTLGSNGKLYGGTRYQTDFVTEAGVLFEYDYINNIYTKKHDFGSAGDGRVPYGIAQSGDGKLYGVTMFGGSNNTGTLFEYDPVSDTYNLKVNFTTTNGALRSHPLYVQTQTITFNALPTKAPGDPAFSLTATGGASGNPVTFTSSNPLVATVSGNTVTIVGVGNTTITASQVGNSTYLSARNVTQTLRVRQPQSITFGAIDAKSFGDAPFMLAATASSGLTVSYSSNNTSVATVSGSTVTIKGAGTITITASQAGNGTYAAATSVPQTLTVSKANQTITFNALTAKNFGDDPFTLSATSSSGLDVSYTSSNTNVATVSGNTVTIVGAGTTTITASQSGNTNYNAASDVDQILTINKAIQAITFGALDTKTFGDDPITLSATASSGLGVSFTSSNTDVATVSENTVTIVGAGTTTITASQSGNTNYNVASDVEQTLTVNKANQSITFAALNTKIFGDDPFMLSATASSGLGVSYTSSNTNVATVSGNTVTIVGAGTTTITASQPGNTNYSVASDVEQTLTVNKANQSITFAALNTKIFGDDPFTLSATASSGLNVNYTSSNTSVATVSGNVVTIVGAGTATITASQEGNDNYETATDIQQTITVNKASQTIAFATLPWTAFGDAPLQLDATTSSGLTVTYVSSNTSVATVSGNILTIVGAGTTTITASQAGDANYDAATDVVQDFTVNIAGQDITFGPLTDKVFGGAPFELTATASSGLPISYTSSNEDVATVSGKTVIIVGAGTATITAWQGGDANYDAANSIDQTLNVVKANQSITFGPLANKTFGDAAFGLTATTNSGLPVNYESSNAAVATISGSTVIITGAGTTSITASQAGNSNYNAATDVIQTLTVNKASQAITFGTLNDKTVDDAAFELTATTSSGLPVSYESSNTAVVTIAGNTVTITGTGTVTITASNSGDENYFAAPDVSQTFNVVKKDQVITFGAIAGKVIGDPAFELTATASSALPVNYTSSNTSVATVSGNMVTIVGAGTTTITALQPGDDIYRAATPVEQTLTVSARSQTITFDVLSDKMMGDGPFALTASASSGLAVTYTSSPDKISINSNIVTLMKPGRVSITASQAGNGIYAAALQVTQSFCIKPEIPSVLLADINSASPLLTSSASEGNQWFLDGVAIDGATGSTVHVSAPGVYTVQVTIDDCVSDLSSGQAVIVTGAENNVRRAGIEVYPNPVSDWLTVVFDDLSGKKEAAIFSLNGVLKASQETEGKETKFRVTDYVQGVYIVRIKAERTLRMVRFIKE